MPAKYFICPTGKQVSIESCLKNCPYPARCLFLPTLRAIAQSLQRNLREPTVTELIAGTREIYLKKTVAYAVDPRHILYALHGTAFHTINNRHTEGNLFSEIRLFDGTVSGQFDLYGSILNNQDDGTLGDLKVTSSYKLMKALGKYKVDVLTGEVYKSGAKKGRPKTRKTWRTDGVHHLLEWALQINSYRIWKDRAFP